MVIDRPRRDQSRALASSGHIQLVSMTLSIGTGSQAGEPTTPPTPAVRSDIIVKVVPIAAVIRDAGRAGQCGSLSLPLHSTIRVEQLTHSFGRRDAGRQSEGTNHA